MTKDALKKIEKEFDEQITPQIIAYGRNTLLRTPKLVRTIKKHYRTALSTLLQQVEEEVLPKDYPEEMAFSLPYDKKTDDYIRQTLNRELAKIRSRLDSVISSVKGI